jgi:putative transposase
MDFVHDQLFDGRPFRILTVVHQLSRESPLIEVDFAMSGQRVADALEARTAGAKPPRRDSSPKISLGAQPSAAAICFCVWTACQRSHSSSNCAP